MKKQILNLGKSLSRAEQKKVNGGMRPKLCSIVCDVNFKRRCTFDGINWFLEYCK